MQTPHSHLPLSLHSFPPGTRHLSSDSAWDSRHEGELPKPLLWRTAERTSCTQSRRPQLRPHESLVHGKPPSRHGFRQSPHIGFNDNTLVLVVNYYLPQITQFSSLSSEISWLPAAMFIFFFTYLVSCIRLIFFTMHTWCICIYMYSWIIYHETFWSELFQNV